MLQRPSKPLERRRRVDADRARLPDERRQLRRNPVLRPRLLTEPVGEQLGTECHRAAAHAPDEPALGEDVEVTADRHLGDVEVRGEVADAHATLGVDASADLLQAIDRIDAHDFICAL